MLKIYRDEKHTCDHIGCSEVSQFSVETNTVQIPVKPEATRYFISVCYEHANTYGSATWSNDYNNVQFLNEKPSETILVNNTPVPFFSEKEIVIDVNYV